MSSAFRYDFTLYDDGTLDAHNPNVTCDLDKPLTGGERIQALEHLLAAIAEDEPVLLLCAAAGIAPEYSLGGGA